MLNATKIKKKKLNVQKNTYIYTRIAKLQKCKKN